MFIDKLYREGPTVRIGHLSIGFYGGVSSDVICADLTNTQHHIWLREPHQCEDIIQARIHSIEVLLLYIAMLYFLYILLKTTLSLTYGACSTYLLSLMRKKKDRKALEIEDAERISFIKAFFAELILHTQRNNANMLSLSSESSERGKYSLMHTSSNDEVTGTTPAKRAASCM